MAAAPWSALRSKSRTPVTNSAPVNETLSAWPPPAVVADHAKRTADTVAAFFLPFIKPGMRLLDVGCGPGTITSG